MTPIRIWAPHAKRVELVSDDQRVDLQAQTDGWFEGTHDFVDYYIALDRGPGRPDPRSGWQPDGIDGPTRVVEHDAFDWTDLAWRGFQLSSAVIYELHVGTFTREGTFDAILDKLDHLVALGIDAIELMPVNEFSGTHGWGYDGVDLYAPHHSYGGPDGLKRLVDACHARGLGVILDVVYNHLGPAGNYLREFGPYFTDKYGTPWGEAINLDGPGSDEVRDFLIGNAYMWFEHYHVDGLRLDAVHAIFDQSALHFLEELAARVDELKAKLGRTLWLIAESDLNDPRIVRPRAAGGYGIDAQWSDDLHHALHARLTGETTGYYGDFGSIGDIATALRQAFVYDGRRSGFRGRRHGRSTHGLDGHRFLAYLQTHDQVGNRARGERTSMLMSNELLKVGAALVMTSPFVPMLFQGEEWGASTPFFYFTDHLDTGLGRAVSEGRRREFAGFGWAPEDIPDPQDSETFARSKLDWTELDEQPHADLLEWHRRLIALRKERAELSDGRMDDVRTELDEAAGWLVVYRGPLTIACNFTTEVSEISVERDPGTVLLSSTKEPETSGGRIRLQPESVTIWSQ
jgi:maltooligosyltrehalose trehalohydrolase